MLFSIFFSSYLSCADSMVLKLLHGHEVFHAKKNEV